MASAGISLTASRAIWYVLLTTLGFGLAGAMLHFPSGFPPNNGETLVPSSAVNGVFIGALSGVLVGLLQWLALRGRLPRAGRWIAMTAVGLGVIHAVGDALPDALALPAVVVIGGGILGALHWLILRGVLASASWWMLASVVSWVIGVAGGIGIASAAGLLEQPYSPAVGAIQHSVVGVVTGLIYGTATGSALAGGNATEEIATASR